MVAMVETFREGSKPALAWLAFKAYVFTVCEDESDSVVFEERIASL